MRDAARMYRESAVRGASPLGLIVILYDEIVRSIRKAMRAFESGDIESRGKALTHAVEVIGYLQSILDFDKGGQVACDLSQFYNLMRIKLLETHIKPTREGLELLANEFAKVAAAWQQAERLMAQPGATKNQSAVRIDVPAANVGTAVETTLIAMER